MSKKKSSESGVMEDWKFILDKNRKFSAYHFCSISYPFPDFLSAVSFL